MWEITLVGNEADYMHFVYFEKMLKGTYHDQVIVAISGVEDSLKFSIAVKSPKIVGSIKKLLIELIIKISKEEYFKANLNIRTNDEELKLFVLMTAVISNLDDEIDYSMVKVKFSKILHIRSFVRFRLSKLYYLWQKYADYFNYTFQGEITDEVYLDFLKFLAESSRSGSDTIYLIERNNHVIFKDNNKKILASIPKNDEIGLVVKLIVCAPNKLIINCYSSLSSKISSLINYLFEDRVSILI